jgi:hypothetical protein
VQDERIGQCEEGVRHCGHQEAAPIAAALIAIRPRWVRR